ncbi:MAG: hypothetical protein AAF411_01400 [Myxococcota bacterium]
MEVRCSRARLGCLQDTRLADAQDWLLSVGKPQGVTFRRWIDPD